MKATQLLHNLGQSLWLDNITRDLLDRGTLQDYIDQLSVTGLTSNPTIFDHAIKGSSAYDAGIRDALSKGKSGEDLFFDLALDDITRAADRFRAVYDRTNTVDGWASLEVSPLLAHDTASTLAAAKQLFARAARPNLLIKIPGTKACPVPHLFAGHRGSNFVDLQACESAGSESMKRWWHGFRGLSTGIQRPNEECCHGRFVSS